ncbi:MAG: hypothetical protein ACE5OZ_07360 [Candidatus Heimdallarchaeota archaeon]
MNVDLLQTDQVSLSMIGSFYGTLQSNPVRGIRSGDNISIMGSIKEESTVILLELKNLPSYLDAFEDVYELSFSSGLLTNSEIPISIAGAEISLPVIGEIDYAEVVLKIRV